MPAILDER